MAEAADAARVRYEEPAEGVARVVMARADARNAQDKRMTYELNDAFDRACADDRVNCIILAGDGPHFSAGHDLRDRSTLDGFKPVTPWGGASTRPAAEGYMAVEQEIYLGMCWRWRNLPKPVIAEVQGKVIAGGLMLIWIADLIIASEDATFQDPVVAFGVNGVEYFGHPWELGVRKAKELLFTGDVLSAQEAKSLGMVNQVVPRAELESYTRELAARIAKKPAMGLKLAKMSVNQAQDAMGFWNALQMAMSLQQLGHANNQERFGMRVDPAGMPVAVAKKA